MPYLKCFLKEGKGDDCLSLAKIDTNQLTSCTAKAEKEFKVLANFKNKVGYKGQFPAVDLDKEDNTKYGVQGSPTLVINGAQSQPSGRDSNALLKTICSGFNNAPKECSDSLSSEAPSPGFGEGTSQGGSSSGCAQ
ncbi:MAG: hypothetical protein PHW52_04955 [Candidatus Pacebacteria bacterium]|nr:hypothetical protein [Candidatus Paceibacterota bacterium]